MSEYQVTDSDFVLSEPGFEQYVLRIHDLDQEDRPREKLLASGPEVLSSAELLAVMMNVGTRKEGVLEMASRLIKDYGQQTLIYERDPQRLSEQLDIPIGKACQIVACFALGRRFFHQKETGRVVLKSPEAVYEHVKDMIRLPKEHLRGLYLNSRYQLIHDETISIGTLTANLAHPREVFRPAIEQSAAAVILVHNHPSGETTPSDMDIELTNKLLQASRLLGIELLDHLVVAREGFCSIPKYRK